MCVCVCVGLSWLLAGGWLVGWLVFCNYRRHPAIGGVTLAPTQDKTQSLRVLISVNSCLIVGQRRGGGGGLNWCQVAYWEMAQRVGERYPAETSIVNVYSEIGNGSLTTTAGTHQNNGMCLQKLLNNQRRHNTTSATTTPPHTITSTTSSGHNIMHSKTGSSYPSHDVQYTRQKIGLGKLLVKEILQIFFTFCF